jgi:hypothetical protein
MVSEFSRRGVAFWFSPSLCFSLRGSCLSLVYITKRLQVVRTLRTVVLRTIFCNLLSVGKVDGAYHFLIYMRGCLHFLGWPEAYFEETTDAQGEGLRRIVDGVKFRRRSRWNRMLVRIRRAFFFTRFGAPATLVFEYGAFVAPFLAIPFDWCGLSSVRCWYVKSAAARDGYTVAVR